MKDREVESEDHNEIPGALFRGTFDGLQLL